MTLDEMAAACRKSLAAGLEQVTFVVPREPGKMARRIRLTPRSGPLGEVACVNAEGETVAWFKAAAVLSFVTEVLAQETVCPTCGVTAIAARFSKVEKDALRKGGSIPESVRLCLQCNTTRVVKTDGTVVINPLMRCAHVWEGQVRPEIFGMPAAVKLTHHCHQAEGHSGPHVCGLCGQIRPSPEGEAAAQVARMERLAVEAQLCVDPDAVVSNWTAERTPTVEALRQALEAAGYPVRPK